MLLMSDTQNGFSTRLKLVERKHTRLARGYDCKVGTDGLIVFRPKRRKSTFPFRGLALMIIGFFCFKGIVMAQIGTSIYEERVSALRDGPVFQQFGAVIMDADPITIRIAEKVSPLFH